MFLQGQKAPEPERRGRVHQADAHVGVRATQPVPLQIGRAGKLTRAQMHFYSGQRVHVVSPPLSFLTTAPPICHRWPTGAS